MSKQQIDWVNVQDTYLTFVNFYKILLFMFLSKRKRVYANEEEPSKKKKKMQDTITCAKCNQQESLSEIGLTEFPTQVRI